jgi:hypothetical protein
VSETSKAEAAGGDAPIEMDDAEAKSIHAVMTEITDLPCPRCAGTDFSVVDAYLVIPTSVKATGVATGAAQCVAAVCMGCGFVSIHSREHLMRMKGTSLQAAATAARDYLHKLATSCVPHDEFDKVMGSLDAALARASAVAGAREGRDAANG